AATNQLGKHVGRVALEGDRPRYAVAAAAVDPGEGSVQIATALVDIPGRQAASNSLRVDFHDQGDAAVHRHGERLGATHAAQACGNGYSSGESAAKMTFGDGGESFISALKNPLRTYIYPTPGRHLPVHRQT